MIFIEFKKPGNKPTDAQAACIIDFCERGLDARWTDSVEQGKEWVDEICS